MSRIQTRASGSIQRRTQRLSNRIETVTPAKGLFADLPHMSSTLLWPRASSLRKTNHSNAWENFNALNHVNLALPATQVDVSGAGQITSTASPMRQMQLGLHFRF